MTVEELGTKLLCARSFVTIAPGEEKHYKILALCDFTSKRRRMTVLVRSLETGRAQALVKGADSMIYSLLSKETDPEKRKVTSDRLREFSKCGF